MVARILARPASEIECLKYPLRPRCEQQSLVSISRSKPFAFSGEQLQAGFTFASGALLRSFEASIGEREAGGGGRCNRSHV
jgi:hypothetical protein